MCPEAKLTIAVLIQNSGLRERFVTHLQSLRDTPDLRSKTRFTDVVLHMVSSLDELVQLLNAQSEGATKCPCIVVSDMLVSDGEFDLQVKERIDPHFHDPLVTLAITEDARRIPEIDGVVKQSAERPGIADVLGILARRLAYMMVPTKRELSRPIRVRQIADEFELHQYYQLRHDVYQIMGYMSEEKEHVESKQEIDGCDTKAIHLGAFENCDGYQRLVGTARVLLAEAAESKWAQWTQNLLKSDPHLRTLVRNETLTLGLPVFQSQHLNDHLQESYEQELLCAELSRVIVSNEFRGVGVARLLVHAAIEESRVAGVDRLYLECLRLHERLYAKFGFRTIPHTAARVIGVNKTMLAMVMELTSTASPTAELVATR